MSATPMAYHMLLDLPFPTRFTGINLPYLEKKNSFLCLFPPHLNVSQLFLQRLNVWVAESHFLSWSVHWTMCLFFMRHFPIHKCETEYKRQTKKKHFLSLFYSQFSPIMLLYKWRLKRWNKAWVCSTIQWEPTDVHSQCSSAHSPTPPGILGNMNTPTTMLKKSLDHHWNMFCCHPQLFTLVHDSLDVMSDVVSKRKCATELL